jgi:hypothetical protein
MSGHSSVTGEIDFAATRVDRHDQGIAIASPARRHLVAFCCAARKNAGHFRLARNFV